MPFKYKQRQNSRNKSRIDVATINNALYDIGKGGSIGGIAMEFAINRNTLRNYVRDRSKVEKLKNLGSQYKASQVSNVKEAKAMSKYLINCSKMNYGITQKNAMRCSVGWETDIVFNKTLHCYRIRAIFS
nr:unnamed protein product [Callosobruchus analis]